MQAIVLPSKPLRDTLTHKNIDRDHVHDLDAPNLLHFGKRLPTEPDRTAHHVGAGLHLIDEVPSAIIAALPVIAARLTWPWRYRDWRRVRRK